MYTPPPLSQFPCLFCSSTPLHLFQLPLDDFPSLPLTLGDFQLPLDDFQLPLGDFQLPLNLRGG